METNSSKLTMPSPSLSASFIMTLISVLLSCILFFFIAFFVIRVKVVERFPEVLLEGRLVQPVLHQQQELLELDRPVAVGVHGLKEIDVEGPAHF